MIKMETGGTNSLAVYHTTVACNAYQEASCLSATQGFEFETQTRKEQNVCCKRIVLSCPIVQEPPVHSDRCAADILRIPTPRADLEKSDRVPVATKGNAQRFKGKDVLANE